MIAVDPPLTEAQISAALRVKWRAMWKERRKAREKNAARMRAHRIKWRAAGLCVNGPSHGAAVKGGRCESCWLRKIGAR